MIVVDIETSGLDSVKNGIWQIGAVDLDTGEEFLEESKIDKDDKILEEAMNICQVTEDFLRDKTKQSQKQMLGNFFQWVAQRKIKNFICQNPQFDMGFIKTKASKYNLQTPFHHRSFDTHSLAQLKHKIVHGDFLINKEKGRSQMNLSEVLKFCGMQDNRGAHNALEDAKLTAECFSRLTQGKNFIKEYSKFKIPDYLK